VTQQRRAAAGFLPCRAVRMATSGSRSSGVAWCCSGVLDLEKVTATEGSKAANSEEAALICSSSKDAGVEQEESDMGSTVLL
jgi:hypothetical protein